MIEWMELRQIRATLPQVTRTLYRLKSNSFPLWNWVAQDRSCPNLEYPHSVYAPASHVLWTCPAAQRHWQHLFVRWGRFGDVDDADIHVWVFALELPERPSKAWEVAQTTLAESEKTQEARAAVFAAANELWRFAVATTAHAIWAKRLRRMEDPSLSPEAHRALAQTSLRRALAHFRSSTYQPGGGEDGRVKALMRSALTDALLRHVEPASLQALPSGGQPDVLYLLFFDGGSRGNPGPGGSGSVIVRVHVLTHSAAITWVASMAYSAKTTTNNLAEYNGLVHGLRQAKVSGFVPLHVVGDSAMVLSQLRMHRFPLKPQLAALYRETRALADDVAVASWAHHYREYNKMAGRAANVAMDTRASAQVLTPTSRHLVRSVEEVMDQDVNHWLETSLVAESEEHSGPAMTARKAQPQHDSFNGGKQPYEALQERNFK